MTRKRGNREGGLYRRADGAWCASLTIGYSQRGSRKRRVVYGKTKGEVQKKLLELQSAAASGTLSDPKRMRLSEYLKHWLEDVSRPTIRPTTYVLYEILLRLHVNPYIGHIALTTLRLSQIQHLYGELEKAGASTRTREKTHLLLNKALGYAVRAGYLQQNPCSFAEKPRTPKKPMRYWNEEQASRFISAAKNARLSALYVLALTTGMRLGELLALKWQNIDFRDGSLSVQSIAYEISGKVYIGEPKTAKGRRKIELPAMALRALQEHRNLMSLEGLELIWVFCDTQGGISRQNHIRKRSFEPLLAAAGVPKIRFHDLRHTAATLLLSKGVHPKVVQERLGHAQISLTLDTYSHMLPSLQKEAASKLDELFERGSAI